MYYICIRVYNRYEKMRRLSAFLLCLAIVLPISAGKRNDFELKRGINMSHWLSQGYARGRMREQRVTEADFRMLKEFGFDHVRIPIDEEQFWDNNGNQLPEAWSLLTRSLDLCGKYGLRAIVDLHIIRSHNFNAVNEGRKNTLFGDPAAQQRLIDMWFELSDSLKRFPNDMVAYEFMNEPVADDPEQWNALIAKVHKAIRSREPQRTLVIGSNMWQSYDTFKDLKIPRHDRNIILSFHYYLPMLLTHYRASWNEYKDYAGPLHYPGEMVHPDEFERLTEKEKAVVKDYVGVEWNRDRLKADMADAIKVARKHHLQLFCGEWGVYETAPKEEKYSWISDMIQVFDEHDIAWTMWNYDSGFGFMNSRTHQVADERLLEILTSGKGL